ncbi:MAG: mechanosensitive ion channel [Gammaproteobacteria bacterium]|nr:mechanosensitive ion channel [Gammaproteobacteria bacterium]MDH3414545.1 mechanosensitive ion channel [Gammaproteobacteria bacterium]
MDPQNFAAQLSDSVGRVGLKILEHLPNLLFALALLLIGWLAARLLRVAVSKIAKGILTTLGRQRLASAKAVQTRTQQSKTWQTTPAVVGAIVYWMVLLFFLAAAVEALGLQAVSNFVNLISAYLPRVLAAILILLVGLWAGEFVRMLLARAAARAELAWGDLLARFVQVIIVLVMAIIAVDELGIESTILTVTFATFFAATFGAAAIAFGLGARSSVSNILASRYVRQAYEIGDVVRVGEHEGKILEITDTAVMLESEQGRVMVPARRFNEESSLLIKRGEPR